MCAFRAELAWPDGGCPGVPDFLHALPAGLDAAIRESLGECFEPIRNAEGTLRGIRQVETPVGLYQFLSPEGAWVIRIHWRWEAPELERSLVDHLRRAGVAVNAILQAGIPMTWQGRTLRIDVREYVSGTHYSGEAWELEALCEQLQRCHRALRDIPEANRIRANAAVHYAKLRRVSETMSSWLKQGRYGAFGPFGAWAESNRAWLEVMVDAFDPSFDSLPGAQALHGEIHPGNVLFDAGETKAVLIDFEFSTRTFAPATWDLAYLVQRFCLAGPSEAQSSRLQLIRRIFGDACTDLAATMRQVAWFLVATVINQYVEIGAVARESECNKFVRLEQRAGEWHQRIATEGGQSIS